MKLYKKTDCQFIEGQIVCNDEIISLDPVVYGMLHLMDIQLQKSNYLLKQPEAAPAPSLAGFKQKSMYKLPYIEKPKTPVSDKQVKQAMAIMAETDELEKAGEVNALITELKPLFDWVASEYVVDSGKPHPKIDLPLMGGDPLGIVTDDLVEWCKDIQKASAVQGAEE